MYLPSSSSWVGSTRTLKCSVSIGRVRGHVPEHLHHVVGADVERVGGEGGVEEAPGLGLAADLHVEHAQADRGVGAGGVGGGGQQEGALGRVVLAAVGQPLAQRGVERRRPGVVRQRRQLGGRRPDGVDQQPARGRQPGQGVLVARVLGHGLARGGLGVDEPLVGDVQVGQQDVRRRVVRVDRQGRARPWPGRRRGCSPEGRPGRASRAPRATSGLICWARASSRAADASL